jgi:hypothetical protein
MLQPFRFEGKSSLFFGLRLGTRKPRHSFDYPLPPQAENPIPTPKFHRNSSENYGVSNITSINNLDLFVIVEQTAEEEIHHCFPFKQQNCRLGWMNLDNQ